MLDRLSVPVAVAEAHGMLCGLLCSLPSAMAKTRWFSELLDAAGLSAGSLAGRAAELHALDRWFIASAAALNDAELGFTPLLPDDEVPLGTRLAALGDYCSGFTYGLGIGIAGRGSRPLPADSAEIVRDFQAIESSDVESDADGISREAESAYIELVEYVRVGVLLIHEELRPVTPAGAGTGTGAAGGQRRPTDPQVH